DGAVLVHTVVVHGHRRGTDVGVLADGRVADVGEVRDLAALADLGVLRLDERADLALAPQPGAGPQVGERSDRRALADDGERAVRADDGRTGADLDVGQGGVGSDGRT